MNDKMETKLHGLINPSLWDRYVLGKTSPEESREVENLISKHPEIATEYERIQKNLEIMAKVNAVEAPNHILGAIMEEVNEIQNPVIQMNALRRSMSWYSIAASFAAIAFAVTAFLLYQKNIALIEENNVVVEEIFDLRGDIQENNNKLEKVMLQFDKLNNPETEKYVLRGNSRAKDLKTVAYINSIDKTSMIDVVSLPQLPEAQQYEIWAELQDKMVNLGILDANDKELKSIPYFENALGLSITIENKNKTPNEASAENSVAEIALRNK